MANSFAPEVIADSSGKWAGNALRFPTREEAEANVKNLKQRWMLVTDTRVVESEDEPNYRWVDGQLVAVTAVKKAMVLPEAAPGHEGFYWSEMIDYGAQDGPFPTRAEAVADAESKGYVVPENFKKD